ncbi:hypothetical protein IFR05_004794 [Cadophora sp. M221]|nr:hypothetical protein IFR05_004794 [Cadophora sp. M221]
MSPLTSKSPEVVAAVSRDRDIEYNHNHNNTSSLNSHLTYDSAPKLPMIGQSTPPPPYDSNSKASATPSSKLNQPEDGVELASFEGRLAALERAAETKFGTPLAGSKSSFKNLCLSFAAFVSAKATWVKVGVVLAVLIMLAFKAGWFHNAFFQTRWVDSSL